MTDISKYIAEQGLVVAAVADGIERTLISEEELPERGYCIRKEMWNTRFDDDPIEVTSAYSMPDGYFIGEPKTAEKLHENYGITVWGTYIDSDSNTCCCGYSPSESKWYGWSHRAIAGFGIGDKVYDEKFDDDRMIPGKHGTEGITDMAKAKRSAQNYARMVAKTEPATIKGSLMLRVKDILRLATQRTHIPALKRVIATDIKGKFKNQALQALQDKKTQEDERSGFATADRINTTIADLIVIRALGGRTHASVVSAGATRQQIFQIFKKVSREIWGPIVDKQLKLKFSSEQPASKGVLADLSYMLRGPERDRATGDRMLTVPNDPTFTLRVADALLEKSATQIRRVMIHEAGHLGYPRHNKKFNDLMEKYGGAKTERDAETGGNVAVQLKVGRRYQTVAEFPTMREAVAFFKEEVVRVPGLYRYLS